MAAQRPRSPGLPSYAHGTFQLLRSNAEVLACALSLQLSLRRLDSERAGAGVKRKIIYSLPHRLPPASAVDVHGRDRGGELDVELLEVGGTPTPKGRKAATRGLTLAASRNFDVDALAVVVDTDHYMEAFDDERLSPWTSSLWRAGS